MRIGGRIGMMGGRGRGREGEGQLGVSWGITDVTKSQAVIPCAKSTVGNQRNFVGENCQREKTTKT